MSKASLRAYELIREGILNGQFEPGSQLKEEEIAIVCGVSRTPVRDAMNRLESEMYIHRTDKQRSFVSDWSRDTIDELFTLRTMLEGYAASRAALRMTPEILAALVHSNEVVDQALAVDDVDEFLRQNHIFHGLVMEAASSQRLAAIMNRVMLQPIVHRTAMRYDREQLARSHAEHLEAVAALRHGDPEWASAVMTAHIRRAYHIYLEDKDG